ncbi:hypothetical protein J2847_004174 [Azospirillum agricola]|uniref:hypothetical protein n=1 Tax=Azospirillum agricola TaxID=1720247 RepID=UPI001AE4FF30|nr:hypothetical protein [Azospirillum agricola]MBP2230865.1 hypothetical protein [Azospirillum agricola]
MRAASVAMMSRKPGKAVDCPEHPVAVESAFHLNCILVIGPWRRRQQAALCFLLNVQSKKESLRDGSPLRKKWTDQQIFQATACPVSPGQQVKTGKFVPSRGFA